MSVTTIAKRIGLAVLAVVALGGAYAGGYYTNPFHRSAPIDFSQLNGVYNILKDKYDGSLDNGKLLDGAKEGLASATGDPYTVYLPADQLKALNDQLSGTLSGIGAEIGLKNNQLVIIAPIAGSPAAAAKLQPSDAIIKIDGNDTAGLSLDEAVSRIRGQAGTKVKLTIVRGNQTPFDVTITRAVITVPSVNWSLKSGNVGYINITQFGTDTIDKLNQATSQLKQQGATKIVLDLRNDPGGYLNAAISVASHFLPAGATVVSEKHGGQTIDKQTAATGGDFVGVPIVVLINGGSASASEILAGALQDNHAATILGETSFGKGSVQEVENLVGGAGLKVTIAHWYTPSGHNITKEGIKPDVTVKMDQTDVDAGRDPQLDQAMQILATK